MICSERLALLFASILSQVALSGCVVVGGCPDETTSSVVEKEVDAADLENALADGVLDAGECSALCQGAPLPGEGSSTSGGSTSDASTSGASTSDGSATATATAGTTMESTTDDSTTDDSTSAGSSTTASMTTASSNGSATNGGDDGILGCTAIEGEAAKISCEYETFCVGGRRPAGLCSEGRSGGVSQLARWLAQAAHLEAASVPAFERVAAELRDHGAPAQLITAATIAAADERRHAALMTAQAARFGGSTSAPEIAEASPRTLLEFAIENAVEGCVGETWAALVAAHQAETAADPELRGHMAEIAADETTHAALAWAIDAWLSPQLSADERGLVELARRRAALALRANQRPSAELCRYAGLPAPAVAEQLWAALDDALWAAAA